MPRAATAPPDPLIDERALVRTLKDLRALVGEEHLLELDNAAALTPLAYVAVQPSAKCGHHCLFQTIAPPMPAAVRSPLFQRGDAVDITGAEHRAVIASGVVTSSTPSGIVVEFPRPVEAERFPRQGVVRLRVDDNPYSLRLRAIELLVRERHALPWVGPVLARGPVAPLADARVQPSGPAAPLTDSQQRALDGAAGCKDVFLIQGPPGTGKTTVISALVTHFVQERGWRVLLTSKGHRAIDNALDRLAAADMHVVRLGAATRVTGAG